MRISYHRFGVSYVWQTGLNGQTVSPPCQYDHLYISQCGWFDESNKLVGMVRRVTLEADG